MSRATTCSRFVSRSVPPSPLDAETLVDYRIHDRNLTADFRGTYAENVRVFDLLLADDVASFGAARLREGPQPRPLALGHPGGDGWAGGMG